MVDSGPTADNDGPGSDLDRSEILPPDFWQPADEFMAVEEPPDGVQHGWQSPSDQDMQDDHADSEIDAEFDEEIDTEIASDIDSGHDVPFGHFIEYHPTLNGTQS